jgi:hypothetical protein
MSWVSFKTYTGMSDPEEAIIDTGAPTSVIPFSDLALTTLMKRG